MTSSLRDHDPVHNPSHYTSGSVECIDAIESALGPEGFIAFLRGQVIRYNWLLGKKDDPVQDAGKAKWYLDLLVERLKSRIEVKESAISSSQQKELKAQAFLIQGAALTDSQPKKEISNGTVINGKTYGTPEWLELHFSDRSRFRSENYPGWHFVGGLLGQRPPA
jgi:hypothetical protein